LQQFLPLFLLFLLNRGVFRLFLRNDQLYGSKEVAFSKFVCVLGEILYRNTHLKGLLPRFIMLLGLTGVMQVGFLLCVGFTLVSFVLVVRAEGIV